VRKKGLKQIKERNERSVINEFDFSAISPPLCHRLVP